MVKWKDNESACNFFSTIVMLQFLADVTGLTQNLDITYNLIQTAASI